MKDNDMMQFQNMDEIKKLQENAQKNIDEVIEYVAVALAYYDGRSFKHLEVGQKIVYGERVKACITALNEILEKLKERDRI